MNICKLVPSVKIVIQLQGRNVENNILDQKYQKKFEKQNSIFFLKNKKINNYIKVWTSNVVFMLHQNIVLKYILL